MLKRLKDPIAGQDELVSVWNHDGAMESCCCCFCFFLCSRLLCKCFYHLWSIINTCISVRGSWFNSNYRGQCIQWWIEQVAELRLGGLDVPGILHQHISYAFNVARSTRMISGSEK